MKKNSSITTSEISSLLGVGTTTVSKRIRQLKEAGVVKRKGARKKGEWLVDE